MKFNKNIFIGDRCISLNSRTFIIAEAGVNHNGDINIAKKLIDAAVECGADAVKFQSFKTKNLILDKIDKAPYQEKTTDNNESQTDMLKKLEIAITEMQDLKKYAESKGIIFLSTPFEEESLNELDEIGVDAYKVAATDLTNIQFLRQVASKKKPIILSAGMCYLEEVQKALEAIQPINEDVILLQCTANYPITDEEANIGVISTFKNKFDMLIGYSDHSKGVGASPYAVALGAKVIEKHFTLSRTMEGPDHLASIEPNELKELVETVRKVEKYVGDGVKMPTCSEQFTRKALQKCLVAKRTIKEGEELTGENIVAKRTSGVGISALYYDKIVGSVAKKDYQEDDIIEQ